MLSWLLSNKRIFCPRIDTVFAGAWACSAAGTVKEGICDRAGLWKSCTGGSQRERQFLYFAKGGFLSGLI